MPYKDYDRTLEQVKKWKKEHPEAVKAEKKRYLQIHGLDIKEYRRRYYLTHKEEVRARNRRYKREIKEAVIVALGGQCIRCGFTDFRALDIHHKAGDGWQERKKYGKSVPSNDYRYYKGLLAHLDDLELLCANCHRVLKYIE